ncbi:MAG: hypothetical protein JXX14_16105, partial [Deltaproteobacteria bacterium]|nr:hypothetical protein [Deltaproteobacteria bacterium]
MMSFRARRSVQKQGVGYRFKSSCTVSLGLWLLLLVSVPIDVRAAQTDSSPTVILLTPAQTAPDKVASGKSDALVTAIRAQLSALPIHLNTRQYEADGSVDGNPWDAARNAAVMYGARVVFWVVQTGSQITVNFHLPDDAREKYRVRVLEVPSDDPDTRFETIAVAVASTLEGLLDEVESAEVAESEPPRLQPARLPRPPYTQGPRRALVEVAIAYTGQVVAPNAINQGGHIRLGITPHQSLHVSIGFTQFMSMEADTDVLRLQVQTRHLDVGICAEILFGA